MQRRKLTFKTIRSNLEDDQRLVGHFNYIVIQQMNCKIFWILYIVLWYFGPTFNIYHLD